MNELTKRLLAEGYDRNHPPEYAKWSSWSDFEYTTAALREMLFEAPCGLIKKGSGYNHGSVLGVTHCPENDNPLFGCPYYDEVPCPHRLDTRMDGKNCAFHQIVREYDYEISVEKLWKEWDLLKSKAWQEATGQYGYCDCMEWDRRSRRYLPRYDVMRCIHYGCENEFCAVTGQKRNLQKVNIYYDILRVWRYQKGLLEKVEKKLEKGVRKFPKAVARTDAEIWLKQYGEKEFQPKMTRSDRRDQFFSEVHGKREFGEYDLFEFSLTVQNVRIEARERRDLAQDLADIANGIEVVHASDVKKQQEQEKRDRREKRREAKQRQTERKNDGLPGACSSEAPEQLSFSEIAA